MDRRTKAKERLGIGGGFWRRRRWRWRLSFFGFFRDWFFHRGLFSEIRARRIGEQKVEGGGQEVGTVERRTKKKRKRGSKRRKKEPMDATMCIPSVNRLSYDGSKDPWIMLEAREGIEFCGDHLCINTRIGPMPHCVGTPVPTGLRGIDSEGDKEQDPGRANAILSRKRLREGDLDLRGKIHRSASQVEGYALDALREPNWVETALALGTSFAATQSPRCFEFNDVDEGFEAAVDLAHIFMPTEGLITALPGTTPRNQEEGEGNGNVEAGKDSSPGNSENSETTAEHACLNEISLANTGAREMPPIVQELPSCFTSVRSSPTSDSSEHFCLGRRERRNARKRRGCKAGSPESVNKRTVRPGKNGQTSQFRGVTWNRNRQKWECSVWLNGRQAYMGEYEDEVAAGRVYDLSVLTLKEAGRAPKPNFDISAYESHINHINELKKCAQVIPGLEPVIKAEIVAYIRRESDGFSRGTCFYRGVTPHGSKFEARIYEFNNVRNVSLGVFSTQDQAGRQYDRALVIQKGFGKRNDLPVTNFSLLDYVKEMMAYRQLLQRRFPGRPLSSKEVKEFASSVTLPFGTVEHRHKPSTVYAEDMRKVLFGGDKWLV